MRSQGSARVGWMVLLALFLWIGAERVFAAEVEVRVGIDLYGGLSASRRVKTLKELRGEGVVFQRLDYSCGSAALGTVLWQDLGVAVTERQIIGFILETGNLGKILQRRGFSLLDLKRFVESQGYRGVGYRLDLESLAQLQRPVVAPIVVHGYRHFVVIRGIREGRVFLSDPARGRLTVPVGQFKGFWFAGNEQRGKQEEGIGFAILSNSEDAGPRGLSLQDKDRTYLDDQQVRALLRDRSLFVPPVPGEF